MPLRGLLGGALLAVAATAVFAACGSSTESGAATVAGSARASRIGLERIGVFSQPVYLAAAPGDSQRLFVVEKAGRIVVLVRGRRRARPFLDISGQVNSSGEEQGLLSMAFAPDYRTSGLFYVYYTDGPGNVRIVQYHRAGSDPNRADSTSARNVLTIDHHTESNHNGGQLQFGPDGDLYIGVGDGGNEGDPHNYGQNTGVLVGKVLRIAPRPVGGYSVPSGNPFAHRAGRRPEIWAYGLRNPWRFSFDSANGNLAIGDVGQGDWEEIDYVTRTRAKGSYFGWPTYEGFAPYDPSRPDPNPNHRLRIAPIIVKNHGTDGYCAIIGGYVVHNPSLSLLNGRYVYSDNCNGAIRSLKPTMPRATGDRNTGLSVGGPSAFGVGGSGQLYVASLGNGHVYQIVQRP
jgi:glucose/arabinose dehydrogenase